MLEEAKKQLSATSRNSLLQITIKDDNIDEMVLNNYMDCLLNNLAPDIKTILLNSFSDLFNFNNISQQQLIEILAKINNCSQVKTVILRVECINLDIITLVKNMLPNKKIKIELSLKNIQNNIQEYIAQGNTLSDIKAQVNKLSATEITAEADIFVGTNTKETIRDAINTIFWATQNGFSNVVLLPTDKTNAEEEYYSIYKIISILPDNILEKVNVSWFDILQNNAHETQSIKNAIILKTKEILARKKRNNFIVFFKEFNYARTAMLKRNITSKYHLKHGKNILQPQ